MICATDEDFNAHSERECAATPEIGTKLTIPADTKTYLAWTFTTLIPGTFRRNKAEFAHHSYPIIAPLPLLKTKTQPIE